MTIAEKQENVVEEFALFDDWMDKYQLLMAKAKELPEFPEVYKDDAHLIPGCQSRVWYFSRCENRRLYFQAVSDSAIVSGLIALLYELYNGESVEVILDAPLTCLHEIGLDRHLSPTRSNGLNAILTQIRHDARRCDVA